MTPSTSISRTPGAAATGAHPDVAPAAFSANPAAQAFNAAVLQHLQAMPDAEWARLRAFGDDKRRFVNHDDVALPDLTREQLVERFVSVDSCSIEDVLVPGYKEKAVQIAQIDGRALFYIQREGVYVMEEKRTGCLPMTRALWVTMPAYPPTW